jgi:hypothetical protein
MSDRGHGQERIPEIRDLDGRSELVAERERRHVERGRGDFDGWSTSCRLVPE